MIEDISNLRSLFEKVKNRGWIPTLRNGTTGIGYTFETAIGKPEEDFPIPDFNTIEIKTRFRNAKKPMTLLNATPDGDYLYPMKRLYDQFGYYTRNNPNDKVFYATISTQRKWISYNTFFELNIDYPNNKLCLLSYTYNGKLVNPYISWDLDILKEKLYKKLKYLAIVKADCKYINGIQSFYYYSINFYLLRDFNTFLKLIESGTIKVTFMIGVYKTGIKKGMMNNHGVGFDIAEEDIEKLFIKIC